jgi:hypothetical protein
MGSLALEVIQVACGRQVEVNPQVGRPKRNESL